MSAFLELDQLSVTFGSRPILKGLAAGLRARSVGLLGPNGAGKSTLLRTLLGFHRPSGGTARVFGHDIVREAGEVHRLVGYMPEVESFVAGMSAVRFLRLMAEVSGLPARAALERAHETLFYVGLGEARYRRLETYSLGMKQLAKLAQAIVHGPKLLILDEPTNGLDPPHRRRMIELIREIRREEGMHLIVSSHLLHDVEECCDEVLVLKDGQLAAHRDLAEERRTNRRFLELEVAGDPSPFLEALLALGCECAIGPRRRLKLVLPEGVAVADLYREAAARSVQIRRLGFRRDSLEDIFLEVMGETHGRV
ncbi:MAG: ABC transporter ATP-binding protein [Acidobacteria bacterium]|nr:ABC transporter ATP-binding protein [Acidobacteriota bacterium]